MSQPHVTSRSTGPQASALEAAMNMHLDKVGSDFELPATLAALVAAGNEMESSAFQAGINMDRPLGMWIRAMRQSIVMLAQVVHGEGQTVAGFLAEAQRTAEADQKTLRATNETARMVLAQARSLGHALEQQSRASEARTFEHLVEKMRVSLTTALGKAIVIRQERYKRMQMSWFGAAVAGAVLGLVIGGYQWCAYENRVAIDLLDRCLAHSVENTLTHQPFCQLTASP